MPRSAATLALLVCLALAPPAVAGEAQDRLFATGVLDDVATGQRLLFAHERTGSLQAAGLPPIEGGVIALALAAADTGGRQARLTLTDAGRARALPPFPADAGHPLLLVFLETTARHVADLTGGSPFYIRNRMREALADQDAAEPVAIALDGAQVAGERLVFRPFAADPNRTRLGVFADLEIRVTVSEAVPGGFARLEAAAGPDGAPGFTETIVFERMEGG